MPRIEMLLVRALPWFQDTLPARWVMSPMVSAFKRLSDSPETTEIDCGLSLSAAMRGRERMTTVSSWAPSASAGTAASASAVPVSAVGLACASSTSADAGAAVAAASAACPLNAAISRLPPSSMVEPNSTFDADDPVADFDDGLLRWPDEG